MTSNDNLPDIKIRQLEPREETSFSLNISPSSHASDTTYSAPGSFSRDASNGRAHSTFFSTPSREQRAHVPVDSSSRRGSPPSQGWLLAVSLDSEQVETLSRVGKRPYSSMMSHPLQEEMGDCFSPCIEVDENAAACDENEEEQDRTRPPSQDQTVEGTPTPPPENRPDDKRVSRREVTENHQLQREPHQGTTDGCVGHEAEKADQVDDNSPCEPQDMPQDASPPEKPLDCSEDIKIRQLEPREETSFSLNISPSSHASDTTYSAPGSFSRDASNGRAHSTFFSTPSREQRAHVPVDSSSRRGSPPSQRWLLAVSLDSEQVETLSRVGKRPYSSMMSHPLQEEMGDCFSPCIEVDENAAACDENEEEQDRTRPPSQDQTVEGTPTPPPENRPDDKRVSRREVIEDHQLQREPYQGTTDGCVGHEAEKADQVDDNSPCEPQDMPQDASPPEKPLDCSEETEAAPFGKASHGGTPEAVREVLKRLGGARGNGELVDTTLLVAAAKSDGDELFESVLDAIRGKLSAQEVSTFLSSALHAATTEASRDERALSAISTLLQYGAIPSKEDIIFLARVVDAEKLDDCFFRAMASAKNSFIPGLNLSLRISGAAGEAQKMEQNKLLHLRYEIDKILTEVLRWLPEKVRDLSGGMCSCAALLEPEIENSQLASMQGPLSLALHCGVRIVTFATSPLGMDYMFQKFTRGLPGLFDVNYTRKVESPYLDPREEAKGHESLTALCEDCWFGRILKEVGRALSADSICTLAVFPGGHFITTGIVALPNAYYKVPAVRMAFDFIVFIGVLVVFTKEVLLKDDGPIQGGEIAFAIVVASALLKEVMELRKNMDQYMVDRWHKLGLLAIQICLVAFIVRVVDGKSSWGPGLYALAAPLLFWRILYFAQIFRFQGAMVQVIYTMAAEIIQFGIVIGAVLLGFAMAFFSLFRELEGLTLSGSLLKVFKAMLGEVGFFDDFSGTPYETVATLLLVLYLVIMTIMLLNLLIAVLSTAHAKVEESVLLRVANARLLMFYRWVAATDILPEPFNLVQMVCEMPCAVVDFVLGTETRLAAKRLVGRAIFWLIMGPVAILGGWVLWLLSLPKAVSVVWGAQTARNNDVVSRLTRVLFCVVLIVIGVPIVWTLSWLAQALSVVTGKTMSLEAVRPPPEFAKSVDQLLREATGGMGMEKMRAIMMNPVKKANVCHSKPGWQDQATTLRHVKALGQWLETTAQERTVKLKADLEEKVTAITEERIGRLEAKLDRLSAMLSDNKIIH